MWIDNSFGWSIFGKEIFKKIEEEQKNVFVIYNLLLDNNYYSLIYFLGGCT